MFKEISSVVLYEVKEKAQVQPGGLHSRGRGNLFWRVPAAWTRKALWRDPGV